MFDHFRKHQHDAQVTYRLAYGFLVILLLAVLAIALFFRSVPFWRDRLHYAPVAVDIKKMSVAWAAQRGDLTETTSLPANERETFQFEFPYLTTREQVENCALKVVVKEKLPGHQCLRHADQRPGK